MEVLTMATEINNTTAAGATIETMHPEYVCMKPVWRKCRDAYKGQQKVKEGGEIYLPAGNGMCPEDYNNYLKRANFYNATKRTVEGLKGAMFRKIPQIIYPDDGKFLINKATIEGKSLFDFSQEVAIETIVTNRVGIMVDYPSTDTTVMTVAEMEALGTRPYLSMYKAENIINWKLEYIGNGVRLKRIVLVENIEDDTVGSVYEIRYVQQYRDLHLDENGDYKQRIYCQKQGGTVDEIITPMKNGKPLKEIPFYICTSNGLEYRELYEPVIKDLVDVNIAHYVNSADREQELYWTGVKTPVLPGWNPEDTIYMGRPLAAPPECTPVMLEASGTSDIQSEMTKKEERMAALGASVISQQGRYVASATTAEINRASENSTLADISTSISEVLSKCITFMYSWFKGSDELLPIDQSSIVLSKDFGTDRLSAQDAIAIIQLWQQGLISKKIARGNLKDGEVIPASLSSEDVDEQIQEEGGVPNQNTEFEALT